MTAPYVPAVEQLVVEVYVRNLDRAVGIRFATRLQD